MAKYRRGKDLIEETEEWKSGARTNWCTGCYRDYPIGHFTTRMYKDRRHLISWCKECVKIRMRPEEKSEYVLVNRAGSLYTRRGKGSKAGDAAPDTARDKAPKGQ